MKLCVLLLPVVLGTVAIVAVPLSKQSNMWEKSGYIEGDIKMAPGQKNGYAADLNRRWPSRNVPYVISGSVYGGDRTTIGQTIAWYNANTCVNMVPRTNEKDYINITTSYAGCYSFLGRIGGSQSLNLGSPSCVKHATIAHELLHAFGFYHMHNSPNRDDYITVTIPFGKQKEYVTDNFGVPYDYGSILHPGPYLLSFDGQPTIIPHDPKAVIGEAKTLSYLDILKLNRMFGC